MAWYFNPMTDADPSAALARLDAALGRIEAALPRLAERPAGQADPDAQLARRHEQLREDTRRAIAELDGLIGTLR